MARNKLLPDVRQNAIIIIWIKDGLPLTLLKPLLQGGWGKLTTVRNAEWHTLTSPPLSVYSPALKIGSTSGSSMVIELPE